MLSNTLQQEPQLRIPQIADVSQPLLAGTGVLTRIHAHARADLLATVNPLGRSDDQHVSGPTPGCVVCRTTSRRIYSAKLMPVIGVG